MNSTIKKQVAEKNKAPVGQVRQSSRKQQLTHNNYSNIASNHSGSKRSVKHKSESSPNGPYGLFNGVMFDKNSEEYKKRRERNNMAVKKSRDKANMNMQIAMNRINDLKRENEQLDVKIQVLLNELANLKSLTGQASSKSTQPVY